MSAKTVLTLSASVLLGAAIAAPNAALAQFGPPPGPPPMLAGPPPGPVAGGPPPVSPAALPWVMLRPDLSLAFRPVAARAHLRAILPLVPIWTVRPDCMVSIAADRPVFVASKLAPRPTAPTATSAIVTPATATAMAMPVAPIICRMRRLRLTPMADPTPPPTTAATTCLRTGDLAPGAFWSVMKTD